MILHRDSPDDDDPEGPDASRPRSPRRFAKMIESTASRRISRPKITLAVLVLSGVVAVGFAATRASRSIAWFVSMQPSQQIAFKEIELVPPPEPWVKGGRLKILEEVRSEAKYPDQLSLLDLDLIQLRKDFQRYPWVEEVSWVERSYKKLSVHLAYRKPRAIVLSSRSGVWSTVIDEEAVPLPPEGIDFQERDPKFWPRGLAFPLIEIRTVDYTVPPKVGVPWKRPGPVDAIEQVDPEILGAARLATFLQMKRESASKGPPAPDFPVIRLPEHPGGSYILEDSGLNRVFWGKAPGDERPGESTSEERWKMLLDYLTKHGRIVAKAPDRVEFWEREAILVLGKRPR